MRPQKNALVHRNQTLRTYLTALRAKLDKYKDLNPTDTEKHQIEIKKLEDWCNEQNLIISSLNNQEDINNINTSFNKKYNTYQQTVYASLVQNEINHKTGILNGLNDLAVLIQNDPKLNSDSTQWLDSLPVSSDLVLSSLKRAQEATQQKQYGSRFNNFYPGSKAQINKASNYLKNILTTLKSTVIKFSGN